MKCSDLRLASKGSPPDDVLDKVLPVTQDILPVVTPDSLGRVISLLEKLLEEQSALRRMVQGQVLEEQSNLRRIVQVQQEDLIPKLSNISESVAALCAQQTKEREEVVKVEEEMINVEQGIVEVDKHVENMQTSERPVLTKHQSLEFMKKLNYHQQPLGQRILHSTWFEVTITSLIILNVFINGVSLQLRGLYEGGKLSLRDDDIDWSLHEARFHIIDHAFNVVYTIELLLRIGIECRQFPKKLSNWVDLAIVASYFLEMAQVGIMSLSVFRLIRISKIFRVAKSLRYSDTCAELRVLVRTLYIAVRGVIWSAVLLSGIVIGGGITMAQLAINALEDDSISVDTRKWLYYNFGTVTAAIYTVFECTFTGAWRFYARRLIEEVGYYFAPFWIFWVIMVNFTTMRVISALFLKETMSVAARDAENRAMMQLKLKSQSAQCLHAIFTGADTDGDCSISRQEFEEMMLDPEVVESFRLMGLDENEVGAFFTVLAADDGVADYEEFLEGALAMASSAPSLDRLKSLQNQLKINETVSQTKILLKRLCQHFKVE